MSAIVWAILSFTAAHAQTGQRFALAIGNEDYSGSLTRLNRPHEDAERVATALEVAGFDVASGADLGRKEILDQVRELANQLRAAGPEAIGFFYYSGHGASVQVGARRQNYLIPVGSEISVASELVSDGVSLETIVSLLEQTGAKAVFIVFDACRNELPWSKGGADPDKAFNTVAARPGMFIAFSTDAGATSPDDGIFSSALATHLIEPGVPHVLAFDAAAQAVGKTRGTDRLPWYSNQVNDRIYFVGGPTPTVPSVSPAGAPQFSLDNLAPDVRLDIAAARESRGRIEGSAFAAQRLSAEGMDAARKARQGVTGYEISKLDLSDGLLGDWAGQRIAPGMMSAVGMMTMDSADVVGSMSGRVQLMDSGSATSGIDGRMIASGPMLTDLLPGPRWETLVEVTVLGTSSEAGIRAMLSFGSTSIWLEDFAPTLPTITIETPGYVLEGAFQNDYVDGVWTASVNGAVWRQSGQLVRAGEISLKDAADIMKFSGVVGHP